MSTERTDLIVVGGGILGLATAWRAHARGLNVTVIDAASRPAGASVQNFGHAAFTVQDDIVQPVAERARQGWTEAAEQAGLWASQPGTWVVARTPLEMQVLEEFAAHRGPEQVRLATAADTAAGVGNPGLKCTGGVHLPLDMRVSPREAPGKIAAHLASRGVDFQWNTAALHIADGRVETNRGTFHAEHVVACPGTGLKHLFPELTQEWQVTTCTLAMALIDRPDHTPDNLGMLTGTGIGRYGGFTSLPSAATLREELAAENPELVGMEANVMVTAIPEGLIVGDSHTNHDSPYPFIEERESAALISAATDYLGIDEPVVRQRWLGSYPASPATNLVLATPDERTTVGVMTTGSGMTLSFGLAERFLDRAPVIGY